MWKYWVTSLLGLFIILMPSLGFTQNWENLILVVSGIVIAVLSFWSLSEARNKEEVPEELPK